MIERREGLNTSTESEGDPKSLNRQQIKMWGIEHIEADSLQEAVNIAEGGFRSLPADRGYIEDSYQLDSETAIWEANDVDAAIVATCQVESLTRLPCDQ